MKFSFNPVDSGKLKYHAEEIWIRARPRKHDYIAQPLSICVIRDHLCFDSAGVI